MARSAVKLASEQFFFSVSKFNDTVGPLFAALRNRFPLDEHHDSGLNRSLGIFLSFCFTKAMAELKALRPTPLSREEWLNTEPVVKHKHLLWQSNYKYLKQRNTHYILLLGSKMNSEEHEFSEQEIEEGWQDAS